MFEPLTIFVFIIILACFAGILLLNKPSKNPGNVSRSWMRQHFRDQDDRR